MPRDSLARSVQEASMPLLLEKIRKKLKVKSTRSSNLINALIESFERF
jgi:hypothetical protein